MRESDINIGICMIVSCLFLTPTKTASGRPEPISNNQQMYYEADYISGRAWTSTTRTLENNIRPLPQMMILKPLRSQARIWRMNSDE